VTIKEATAQQEAEQATAAPVNLQCIPGSETVPKPQRSPELAHMTLGRLRTYRETLLMEEVRVSYWRRLVQARRDLLRAGSPLGDHSTMSAILSDDRGHDVRRMMLVLHPAAGLPVLPRLPHLWASLIDAVDSEEAAAELFGRLGEAEAVLSSYREALHRRLNRATADLVARYCDEPRLCLVALPLTA
jgi:hypothetical protein